MINFKARALLLSFILPFLGNCLFAKQQQIPLYYWQAKNYTNFGDYLSLKLVERIVGSFVESTRDENRRKLLAIGSILAKAIDGDVVWGSGVSGKRLQAEDYKKIRNLDVRAVRGPLTRQFLMETFGINCPEIYGDPALLVPWFFPELKKNKKPTYEYIIIPHYTEQHLFPKDKYKNVVYPTEPWDTVIKKILDSKFVIAGALHGIIIADAYHIPARWLRVTENEPVFKYQDYYLGTNRPNFRFATSVEEALKLGGEAFFECDLKKLYAAFPFDCWLNKKFQKDLDKVAH